MESELYIAILLLCVGLGTLCSALLLLAKVKESKEKNSKKEHA